VDTSECRAWRRNGTTELERATGFGFRRNDSINAAPFERGIDFGIGVTSVGGDCRWAHARGHHAVGSSIESTSVTSLAMAADGRGVAIIPFTLRTRGSKLRIRRVTYRGRALRQPLSIYWDARRPLPRYGKDLLRNVGGAFARGFSNHGPIVRRF
jgi:hypothetical protein